MRDHTNHANGIALLARLPPQPSRCIIGSRRRNTWTRARPQSSRMARRRSLSRNANLSNIPTYGDSSSACLTNCSACRYGGLVTIASVPVGTFVCARKSATKSKRCAALLPVQVAQRVDRTGINNYDRRLFPTAGRANCFAQRSKCVEQRVGICPTHDLSRFSIIDGSHERERGQERILIVLFKFFRLTAFE